MPWKYHVTDKQVNRDISHNLCAKRVIWSIWMESARQDNKTATARKSEHGCD